MMTKATTIDEGDDSYSISRDMQIMAAPISIAAHAESDTGRHQTARNGKHVPGVAPTQLLETANTHILLNSPHLAPHRSTRSLG